MDRRLVKPPRYDISASESRVPRTPSMLPCFKQMSDWFSRPTNINCLRTRAFQSSFYVKALLCGKKFLLLHTDVKRQLFAMTAFTAVSAPGKVLLAGGYLVLDRKHTASTFALDARIHVVMQQGVGSEIRVRSPQFKDAVWRYSWDSRMRIQDVGDTPNPFVKTALQYALAFVSIISKAEDLMLP